MKHSLRISRTLCVLAAGAFALTSGNLAVAQTGSGWSGGTNSDMQTSSNWDNGFGSNFNLFFGSRWNTNGRTGSTTVNNASNYSGYRLNFENIATNQTFTLQGSQVTLFDFGGNSPAVINSSSVNQNVNFTGGNGLVFNSATGVSLIQANGAAGGNVTIGGPVLLAGTNNQLQISGANANSIIFNGVISTSTSGTNSVVVNLGSSGTTTVYAAANSYAGDTFVDSGTLQFGTSGSATGSANNSTIRLGQTSGTQNSTITLATLAGGQNIGSLLNPRNGNSGVDTLSSLNTSGTNTWSGNLALDHDLFVSEASGGTLTFSGSTIDIKAQTLSIKGAGGTVNFTSAISNSIAGGQLVVGTDGVVGSGGTVVLSAANTFTGQTFVRNGSLSFTSGGSVNNSTIRLGSDTAANTATASIDLITLAGGTTLASTINPVSTGTGLLTVNSDNTSGTNTLSAHIGLDRNLTITQAAGAGALNITQGHTDGATNGTGYDIKGFTATFTPGTGSTINDSGDIYSSTGTGSVTMNGTGTLTLSGGVNNNFAGGVSVISGTLALGSDTGAGTGGISLGGTSANTPTLIALNGSRSIANNVTLLATSGGGNPTIAGSNNLTLNGALTNSGANRTLTVNNSATTTQVGSVFLSEATGTGRTLTINGTGNMNISGAIANFNGSGTAGSLTYSGSGALTLSGPNTYSGTTTLTSGGLNINSATALATSAFALNGGTIDNTSANPITLTNNNTVTLGGNFTFGGTKDLNFGTGAVSNNASRTITLNGSGSTLTLGGTLTETNSDTLTVNGTGNTLSLGGLGLSGTATARTQTFAGTGNVNITGAITNGSATSGDLAFTGTGTMVLSGPNTYSDSGSSVTTIGTTAANAGTLRLAGSGTLGATSNGLTIRGGTLDLNGTTQTIGTLLLGGGTATTPAITLGGGTLNLGGTVTYSATNNPNGATISGAGAVNLNGTQSFSVADSTNASTELTISSVIANGSGTSGLTKSSSGVMQLSGTSANTYTGLTTVTSGELDLNKTAGVNAIAGDGNTSTNDVNVTGGTLRWLADEQVGDTATITAAGGTVDLNGHTETLGSLIVNSGTFQTGAGHLIGTTATVQFNGGASTINSGGIVEDGHFVVTGGTNTVQGGATEGLMHLLSGGVGLQMTGANITLNSDATNPGRLLIEGAVSTLTSSTTSTITSGGAAANPGTVDLGTGTRTFTTATGSTLSGIDLSIGATIIAPGGALTKAGTGTMELTAANTYAGGTIVSAGTLLANNASGSATGSGGVMINAGGTLGGTGSINAGSNNININDNGTITGGKNGTVGALTMTASSVIFGGSTGNLSTYAVDISGATSDRLNITGVLNLSGAFDQITFTGAPDGISSYVLATYTSETGTFDNMPSLPAGYQLVYGSTELDLTLTAVPETSTWVMGALALSTLLWSQRNRLQRKRQAVS